MTPHPHIIRPNKSAALPSRSIVVYATTAERAVGGDYFAHTLVSGTAAFWQRPGPKQPARTEWHDFTTAESLWRWAERYAIAGRRLVIVLHGAGFNLQVLGGPTALTDRGWTITAPPVLDSDRLILRASRAGASIMLLDVQNFVPMSLRKCADLLGHALAQRYLERNDVPDYAENRYYATILLRSWQRWIGLVESLNLGYFATTAAKQAIHGFRHAHMSHQIVPHHFANVNALERAAYFGGRTEAYRLGQLPPARYTKLDGNQMFGAVMREYSYPIRFERTLRTMPAAELRAHIEHSPAIAQVELEATAPIYPTRHNGRVVFPLGRFVTSLTTPELAVAIDRGDVRSIGRVVLYAGAPIFRSWIDFLYGARIAARDAGRLFEERAIRLLISATYGRFALRYGRWSIAWNEPGLPDERFDEYDADAHRTFEYRRVAGRVELRGEEEEGQDTFYAIPAHVTAYTRLAMWHYIEKAGQSNVFYIGTDSLIVNDEGRARLSRWIDPQRLGALKVEDESDDVEIGGQQVYRMGRVLKQKGRKADARSLGAFSYEQREAVGIASRSTVHHIGGAVTRTVRKIVRPDYHGGTVHADGTVTPLVLPAVPRPDPVR